jgi:hypothetical protein
MSDEKKPREFWIHEITTEINGDIQVAFTFHVIEKSAYDKLTAENAKLRAENYVLRDQGLRTYDGLAQKADRADELQRKLEIATRALTSIEDTSTQYDNNTAWRIANIALIALKEIGE